MAKDPVCGMEGKIKAHGHYFCSKGCIKKYESQQNAAPESKGRSLLKPLAYAVAAPAMVALAAALHFSGYMIAFMGGFFVVVSLLKVIDWKGFAKAFATYDLIAKKSMLYAFAYPVIEFSLGVAYLLRFQILVVAALTLVIMTISSAGIAANLLQKNPVRCACLGTKIRLPLTGFTLFEDLIMAVMALVILLTFSQ